ncbi:low molecular weight protein-tyrosine phosphatase [Synechococcus sp. MEDNS5]|uniref:arsenate reductase/protein-tyrosine-phosphatase family protein n=1 Tax=Synechococcus sp. MEDNS5 TaxID=1442554 RepID=UPI0016442CB4|nr:low molecular weight phosphatase family protein [Synechococcus sp. MEDNS5]QNJ05617.1 low molecular weight protein-tyrosine phosphatase [Synechococcus sp. MEDNS5]|tara:strand:+ start:269 stop:721 length:453 start_codon:yes stop_codon:yes gene_type:complete
MRTVLFLCTGNYFRSRFSELWFNHQIVLQGHDDDVHAVSAGLKVTSDNGNIGAMAVEAQIALQQHGVAIDPTQLAMPRQVSRDDVEQADVVVAVDADAHRPMVRELFPDLEAKIRFWSVKDLDEVVAGDDPIALLQHQVDQLINALITGH